MHTSNGLVVLLMAVVNTTIVGVAIGAYGPRTLALLPHLSLEWLALAGALAVYSGQRRSELPPGRPVAPSRGGSWSSPWPPWWRAS